MSSTQSLSASPTPTTSGTPSASAFPVRALASELGPLELTSTVRVVSSALVADPGPRLLSASAQFAPGSFAQPWTSADVASLLATGALSLLPGVFQGGAPSAEWVSRVASSAEAVVFVADLWAFAPEGAAPTVAVARGVPTGPASWVLPCAAGKGALLPSGIALTATSATWSFTGLPAAPIAGAAARPHVFSASTNGALGVTLLPGSLRPGYVYVANATFALTASWHFGDAVAAWTSPLLAGIPAAPGVRVLVTDAAAALAHVSYSALVYSHAPPWQGTLTVSGATAVAGVASGAALSTQFTLATSGWSDADALVLDPTVPSLRDPTPALAFALAAGQLPLPLPSPADASAACALLTASSPAWVRAQRLASTLLGEAPAVFCSAVVSAAAKVASSAGASYAPSTTSLTVALLIDVAGANTALTGGAWPYGLTPLQPFGGVPLSLGGYLALLGQQELFASVKYPPLGATLGFGSAAATSPYLFQTLLNTGPVLPTVDTSALLSAAVRDVLGSVGVAWASALLTPPLPSSPSLNQTITFANAVATMSSTSPPAIVIQDTAAASVVVSAAASSAVSGPVPPAPETVALLSSTTQTLLANVVEALGALAGGSTASASSNAVTNAATALAQLTAQPSTVSAVAAGSAVSGVSSSLTSGVAVSVPAAQNLLGALSNVAGTAATASPTPAPTGYVPVATDAPAPVLTGGIGALASNFSLAVSQWADALAVALAAAPVGAQQSFSSAPPTAVSHSPVTSYCGPAITVTVGSLSLPTPTDAASSGGSRASAGDYTLSLNPPLNPCFPPASLPSRVVTLPTSLVADQPPPSLQLSSALVSSLVAGQLSGAGPTYVRIVQYGVSPYAESAGFKDATYSPLVPVSDLPESPSAPTALLASLRSLGEFMAATVMSQSLSGLFDDKTSRGSRGLPLRDDGVPLHSPPRSRGTSTLFSQLKAVITGVGGQTANAASGDALRTSNPRATVSHDLLPSRPLDSRVVSIAVAGSSGGGSPIPLRTTADAPFLIVVPLRDVSIVRYYGGVVHGVNVGQGGFASPVINATCPSSPTSNVRAWFIAGHSSGPANVTIQSFAAVTFTGVVGTEVQAAAVSSDTGSIVAPGGTSAATDTLSGSGANAPTFTQSSYTYVLQTTSCGDAWGSRSFVCGPGAEGTTITYACPVASPVPVCVWFNTATQLWSTDGCSVAFVNVTSITCACMHLPGDFAVRFATLTQVQADVFAVDAPVTRVSSVPVWVAFFSVVGTAVGLLIMGSLCGVFVDRSGSASRDARFAQALGESYDVKRIVDAAAAGGRQWHIAPVGRGRSSLKSASVAPWDELGAYASAAAFRSASSLPPSRLAQRRNGHAETSALYARAEFSLEDNVLVASSTLVASNSVAPSLTAVAPSDAFSDSINDLVIAYQGALRQAAELQATSVGSVSSIGRNGSSAADGRNGMLTADGDSYKSWSLLQRATLLRMAFAPPALLAVWWWACVPRARRPAYPYSLGAEHPCLRLFASLASAFASLAATAVLANYLVTRGATAGTPALPSLSPGVTALLGVASAFLLVAPIDALSNAAAACVARARAAARFPALDLELRNRDAASHVLSQLPTSVLLRVLTELHAARASEGKGKAASATTPAVRDGIVAASASQLVSMLPSTTDCHLKPPPASSPLSPTEAATLDDATLPGWIDPPKDAFLYGLLASACGRHVNEKADFAAAVSNAASFSAPSAASLSAALADVLSVSSTQENAQRAIIAHRGIALAVGLALLLVASVGALYAFLFALVRGFAASQAVAGAWVLAWALTLLVIRPAAMFCTVATALGCPRHVAWLPVCAARAEHRALSRRLRSFVIPAAAGAAVGAPPADAVIGLAPLGDLAIALLPHQVGSSSAEHDEGLSVDSDEEQRDRGRNEGAMRARHGIVVAPNGALLRAAAHEAMRAALLERLYIAVRWPPDNGKRARDSGGAPEPALLAAGSQGGSSLPAEPRAGDTRPGSASAASPVALVASQVSAPSDPTFPGNAGFVAVAHVPAPLRVSVSEAIGGQAGNAPLPTLRRGPTSPTTALLAKAASVDAQSGSSEGSAVHDPLELRDMAQRKGSSDRLPSGPVPSLDKSRQMWAQRHRFEDTKRPGLGAHGTVGSGAAFAALGSSIVAAPSPAVHPLVHRRSPSPPVHHRSPSPQQELGRVHAPPGFSPARTTPPRGYGPSPPGFAPSRVFASLPQWVGRPRPHAGPPLRPLPPGYAPPLLLGPRAFPPRGPPVNLRPLLPRPAAPGSPRGQR